MLTRHVLAAFCLVVPDPEACLEDADDVIVSQQVSSWASHAGNQHLHRVTCSQYRAGISTCTEAFTKATRLRLTFGVQRRQQHMHSTMHLRLRGSITSSQ